MTIERNPHKIYSSWAFKEGYSEKSESNNKAHQWLQEKYNIQYEKQFLTPFGKTPEEIVELRKEHKKALEQQLQEADVVYKRVDDGYARTDYAILKNSPGLSDDELALICDGGNLCFGYRVNYLPNRKFTISIYTD